MARALAWLIALAATALAAPVAMAQDAPPASTIVTSAAPDSVAVTLYRSNYYGGYGTFDLDYLRGFALIRETRRVTLPPGPVTLRFEGVASGLQPESALVHAVDITEKNQDRRLLSQRGLLESYYGRSVTIRRYDRATGTVSEEPATIIAEPDRLVLRTAQGVEALQCTGRDDTLLFPAVPRTLTAKPTFSVEIADQPGGEVTIELTYLADGFNWQANYVADLNAEGDAISVTGWLTMASADATSFPDAELLAVAGRVFREAPEPYEGPYSEDAIEIYSNCWPQGRTHQVPAFQIVRQEIDGMLARRSFAVPPPPPPPAAYAEEDYAETANIIVTASRIASQENLGDLKLYRIPFPVTLASQSQKQVAFLGKERVEGEIVYRLQQPDENSEIQVLWRMQNEKEEGLGDPLPKGNFAFFQRAAGERHLVGEARMEDKTVGEEVELEFAEASNVTADAEFIDTIQNRKGDWDIDLRRLTVRNANGFPIIFEAEFVDEPDDDRFERFDGRTFKRDGATVWRVTVPANGTRVLNYRRVDL